MCGIYAIINAFRALCREITWEISTHLFQHLVSCLERHAKQALFPIIFGTGTSLMRKLLGEAQSYLKKRLKIELAIEPKGRELKSKSLEAAWKRLSAIVDETTVLILPLSVGWITGRSYTTSMREKFDWSIRATVASLRGRIAPLELQKRGIAWSFRARSRLDGYAAMINSAPRGQTRAAPCASGISVFGFRCVCLDLH
jgi:hypothetical protein